MWVETVSRQSPTTKPSTFEANEEIQKMIPQRRETLFFLLIKESVYISISKMCQKSNLYSSSYILFITFTSISQKMNRFTSLQFTWQSKNSFTFAYAKGQVYLPLRFPAELANPLAFFGVDDWQEDAWLPKALEAVTGGVNWQHHPDHKWTPEPVTVCNWQMVIIAIWRFNFQKSMTKNVP